MTNSYSQLFDMLKGKQPFMHQANGPAMIGDPGQAISNNAFPAAASMVAGAMAPGLFGIAKAGGAGAIGAKGIASGAAPLAAKISPGASSVADDFNRMFAERFNTKAVAPTIRAEANPNIGQRIAYPEMPKMPQMSERPSIRPINQTNTKKFTPLERTSRPMQQENVTNNFANPQPGNAVVRQYEAPQGQQAQTVNNMNRMMDGEAVRPQGFQSVQQQQPMGNPTASMYPQNAPMPQGGNMSQMNNTQMFPASLPANNSIPQSAGNIDSAIGNILQTNPGFGGQFGEMSSPMGSFGAIGGVIGGGGAAGYTGMHAQDKMQGGGY